MRQSGLLLDENRDASEACVTRPLVIDKKIWKINMTRFNY